MNQKSKWIWVDNRESEDTYGEFYTEFNYTDGKVYLNISSDSNYVFFLNGEFVESGQYPDFPHYKVYDNLDITKYCKQGTNKAGIVVWYYGIENMSYYAGKAALKFEIYNNDKILVCSNENILSRYSLAYQNGLKKMITKQLGFSFLYDATCEDDWLLGNLKGFTKSAIVNQDIFVFCRTIDKLRIDDRVESTLIKRDKNYYLYDLHQEEVGYLSIKVNSKIKQRLTICYGEHISDGQVRRCIGDRDFSVQVVVGEGVTEYTNYFLRLGLRYLEIHTDADLEIEYASVLPCVYPLKKKGKFFQNELHQKIYDISVRTLELCMHDHYEDCPWREQALYTMDSRNQMLCGYYAFSEYKFPRDNLYLMSKDNRSDGLLSICTPTSINLIIPSFSLHYFTQVYEYTIHSQDLTLAREILPKLKSIMSVFESRMENGLVPSFAAKNDWNFYEWTDGLAGSFNKEEENLTEAALNCLVSIALQNLQKICNLLDVDADYDRKAKELNRNIRSEFFDEKSNLYVNVAGENLCSELVNSWAVLCGASQGAEAEKICDILASDNLLTKISLSMLCFKFDALLKMNKEKYKDYIIHSIEQKYKPMIEAGATTFWETEKGEKDFDNAGSLCHGWSAMPIVYFNQLL